jgi:hypothetical protein
MGGSSSKSVVIPPPAVGTAPIPSMAPPTERSPLVSTHAPVSTPVVDNGILDKCSSIKQVEYIFYIGAQLSRLVYCDSGIIQESLKALGEHPDVFNKVITTYDHKYLSQRVSYTKGVPAPDSYTMINQCAGEKSDKPLVKYISSPTDTTCMVVNPSAIIPNENSIILPTDGIIVFKGSSSLRNWSKNLGSLVSGSLNASLIKKFGSTLQANPDFKITTSFLNPLLEIFDSIVNDGFSSVFSTPPTRVFVFGHSKGGAECEIMGMLLSLMLKVNVESRPSQLAELKEVHVISYGAPKILASSAYSEFNRQILSKNVTVTRIESVGRLVGDAVTAAPPLGAHPGITNTQNTIDTIRSKYGITVDGNYRRNEKSWPFSAPYNLWDPANKAELDKRVQDITGQAPPTQQEIEMTSPKEPLTGGYYVKVKGARDTISPHAEQLGMYFMGSQRISIPGRGWMKNPANTTDRRTFTSDIWKDCSVYKYVDWKPFSGGKRKTYRKNMKKSKTMRR